MSEKFGKPIAELTFLDVHKMDKGLFRELLRMPEGAAKVNALVTARNEEVSAREKAVGLVSEEVLPAETPSKIDEIINPEPVASGPTSEEQAAAEAAEAEAARIREQAAAAEEVARVAAAKAVEDAKPKRFVIDFQAKDDQGNPIGKKTHLEASSQEELLEKMQTSYEHAVRALDRLKKQKPTFKQDQPTTVAVTQEQLDQAIADVTSDDPAKRRAAIDLLAQQKAEAFIADAKQKAAAAAESKVSLDFLRSHLDYYNCEANNEKLSNYLRDNNLEWTVGNLEIAFGNLEAQLAENPNRVKAPVQETAPAAAANPAPAPVAPAAPTVAPAASAAPVAPVAPVAPAAPAAPAPVAPANPPARRPGVNGGIIPGTTTSGVKPQPMTAEQARKELIKELKTMSAEEMKRRHKMDPKFYDKVNAALAKR